MDSKEIAYLRELQESHQQRLRQLRLREARLGFSFPPEDRIEVQEIEDKIAEIERKIADIDRKPLKQQLHNPYPEPQRVERQDLPFSNPDPYYTDTGFSTSDRDNLNRLQQWQLIFKAKWQLILATVIFLIGILVIFLRLSPNPKSLPLPEALAATATVFEAPSPLVVATRSSTLTPTSLVSTMPTANTIATVVSGNIPTVSTVMLPTTISAPSNTPSNTVIIQASTSPTPSTPPPPTAASSPSPSSPSVSSTFSSASPSSTESPPTISPSCTPRLPGLVGWWPGDGKLDDIVGQNNGTSVGTTSWQQGKVDQAFHLDGSNYIRIPNADSLAITDQITLSAWVNPDDTPQNDNLAYSIITKWEQDITKDAYGIWLVNTSGQTALLGAINIGGVDQGLRDTGLENGSIASGEWSHVAMTYNSVTGINNIYVNGKPVNNRLLKGKIVLSEGDTLIGAQTAQIPRLFHGTIDEVQIFNRELSDDIIKRIFLAGNAGMCK